MSQRLPDFIVIGGMKCGTSALHEQLSGSDAFYMSEPKEPNFFSNDSQYAHGIEWYGSLFSGARADQFVGESSTHYTKLPTYPNTVSRLAEALPRVKLIYVLRDPIERLISQYIHEWSERNVSGDINQAVSEFPELVYYSKYAYQLRPYLKQFGPSQLLSISFERMKQEPNAVLNEISAFVGGPTGDWSEQLATKNPSSERLRKSRLLTLLMDTPGLRELRRGLVPRAWRNRLKRFWMINERPTLGPETRAMVQEALEPEVAELGRWLGRDLTVENFSAALADGPLSWTSHAPRPDERKTRSVAAVSHHG